MAFPKEWLRTGPSLEEIIESTRSFSKDKSHAIIIPVHNELEYLKTHLDKLASQTTKAFDVIIVHSPDLDVSGLEKGRPYGIVFLRLKQNLGAAGGFYAGERYALGHGYSQLILADVDCLPVSSNLVERMFDAASSKKGAVFLPSVLYLQPQKKRSGSLHWYGAMDRSVLERAGLTYLPIFIGSVDIELGQRILGTGTKFEHTPDVSIDHPSAKHVLPDVAFVRALYAIRNHGLMIFNRIPTPSWNMVIIHFSSMCLFDRFNRLSRALSLALEAIWDLATLNLLSRYVPEKIQMPPYGEMPLQDTLSSRARVALIPGEEMAKSIAKHCSSIGVPVQYFRGYGKKPFDYLLSLMRTVTQNNIIFVDVGRNLSPLLLLFPSVYLYDDKQVLVVQRNSNVLSRFIRFLISMCAFASLIAIYLPISFISWLRLRGAMRGYGIPKKK